jgi:hypothetical protein
MQAFSSDGVGPVVGHLLLALLDVAAAVVAIVWPGITAYALTIWIGAWAVVTGIWAFALAFASGERGGQRVLFGLGGLLSVALGIVLFARPGLYLVGIEGSLERIPHFEVAAESHDEQEGPALAPDSYPDEMAIDADEREQALHLNGHFR